MSLFFQGGNGCGGGGRGARGGGENENNNEDDAVPSPSMRTAGELVNVLPLSHDGGKKQKGMDMPSERIKRKVHRIFFKRGGVNQQSCQEFHGMPRSTGILVAQTKDGTLLLYTASQEPQILLANLTVTTVPFLRYQDKVTVS